MVSKLLFIPRHETSWSKMEKIIEYLKSEFNCEILVFSKELDKLIKNKYKKIKIINYKKRNLLQIFLHYIDSICEKYLDDSNFFFFEIIRIFITSLIYKFEIAYFISKLRIINPDLILLPGDRELSPILTITKAAKILNISSVVCVTSVPDPICLHTQRLKSKKFFVNFKESRSLINKLAGYFLPGQTFLHNNQNLLFSPGWRTFGLFFSGCISKRPWIQGGGNVKYVFEADSKYRRIAELYGRSQKKTIIIGDPHNEIIKKNKNKKKKDIILFCPPQDAEHNLLSWKNHKNRIYKISLAIKNLKKSEPVFFNLHPKSNLSDYKFLKEKFGFIQSNESFSKQIFRTKLLIASASSIIPIAVAARVPVFNIDDLFFWNEKIIKIDFGVKTLRTLDNLQKDLLDFYKEIHKQKFQKKLFDYSLIMSKRLLVEKNFQRHIVEIIKKILKKT